MIVAPSPRAFGRALPPAAECTARLGFPTLISSFSETVSCLKYSTRVRWLRRRGRDDRASVAAAPPPVAVVPCAVPTAVPLGPRRPLLALSRSHALSRTASRAAAGQAGGRGRGRSTRKGAAPGRAAPAAAGNAAARLFAPTPRRFRRRSPAARTTPRAPNRTR